MCKVKVSEQNISFETGAAGGALNVAFDAGQFNVLQFGKSISITTDVASAIVSTCNFSPSPSILAIGGGNSIILGSISGAVAASAIAPICTSSPSTLAIGRGLSTTPGSLSGVGSLTAVIAQDGFLHYNGCIYEEGVHRLEANSASLTGESPASAAASPADLD